LPFFVYNQKTVILSLYHHLANILKRKNKKSTRMNTQEENKQTEETLNEVNAQENAAHQTEETNAQQSHEEEIKELNDKYLRLYSDFENYRKRTAKERLDLIQTASSDVIKTLLPVLDDFERAIQANEKIDDINTIKEGLNLVHQKFKSSLQSAGLKEIEVSAGKDFDLDFHEAITTIPAPEDKLKGKIVDVVGKGYMLGEKVIRYTKVVIGE
jgi:molecular chaperone GrpE